MIEIIGGMVAALIAYGFNRMFLKGVGDRSIVFIVPFVEELSKTSIAILIGSSIIGAHVVFGMIEALYDLIHTKNQRAGPIAAFISIISHSTFGVMTYYILLWTEGLFLAIVIVTVVHSLWNYFVTR